MAYITSEQVKEMRNLIKAAFPAKDGWKWSVTKEHHSSVIAALMEYPEGYDFGEGYQQVNHYWFERNETFGKRETAVLKKVNEILHIGHWDESDIMTDYFHCSHYVNLHIGKWDRPAVAVKPKAAKVRKAKAAPKAARVAAPAGSERDYLRVAEFIGIQF